MIFKPGDKVYSYRHGIVTLVETEDALTSGFPVGIKTEIGIEGYTAEGRCLTIDKFPSIVTLEFAERRGLVLKRNVRHKRRHAYIDERDNSFHITTIQRQVVLLRCILQSVCPTNNKYINACLNQLRDLSLQQARDSGGSE